MAYQRLKACARPVCVQRWCGCERAWRTKAATLSRPNAQVKQLTSVTVGVVVFFFVFVFFLSNCYFYCGRQKHFHFNSLSALLMLGKINMLWKWNRSIVLGQNYKIKHVGNLFIYCYKVFFEERYAKKLLPTWNVYLKIFFFHPGSQEYKKEQIYLTITYCDSSNSTNFHFMEFICWRWFKLSFVLSCGNISYVVKNIRILN